MRSTESQLTTATKLKRIAWLSSRDGHKQFDSLTHHFNEESLEECFHQLDGRKAVGIDGMTKAEYAHGWTQNLQDLVSGCSRWPTGRSPCDACGFPRRVSWVS